MEFKVNKKTHVKTQTDSLIRRRTGVTTVPDFRIGAEEFDRDTCALVYILAERKVGSSGDQKDPALWDDPFAMIKATHDAYDKRSEPGSLSLAWGWIHLDLIPESKSVKNHQYDKPLRKHLKRIITTIKFATNKEFISQIRPGEEVTQQKIIDLLHDVLGREFSTYPPHILQKQDWERQEQLIKDHLNVETIIDLMDRHTRIGKDKLNANSIGYQVNLLPSGFFATWQIVSELDPAKNAFIETRGKTQEKVKQEICQALLEGKTLWIAMSSYKSNTDRYSFLKLFRDTDVRVILDEPDYQIHKQDDFLKMIIKWIS
jgi:hypothetical protein